MEPCRQEANMATMQGILSEIREENKGIRKAQDRSNTLLASIAEQGAEIRHLRSDYKRNEDDINELFGRVRGLELAPGKSVGKLFWVIITAASGAAGGVFSALAVWVIKGSGP